MCKNLKKLNKKLSFLIKIGYTKDIKIEAKRTFVIRFQSVELYEDVYKRQVFHFHMHLIPRYENDQVGLTWTPGTLTEEVKEEILAKLSE